MRLSFSPLALTALTLLSATNFAATQDQADRPRYEKIAPEKPIDVQDMQARAAAGTALPTWTGNFSYQGVPFNYTMIGTDPSKGSASTSVRFVLIPVALHFSDGNVLDPTKTVQCNGSSTALELMEQSPLFANTVDYKQGGTDVGTTQYLDAFQRAEFWNFVGKSATNYHVLLDTPIVTATQTLTVPANKGSTVKGSCGIYGKVDMTWFDGQLRSILTSLGSEITPATLAYALTYDVVDTNPTTGCCVLGYHAVSSGIVYGTGTYNDENAFGTDLDVVPTSHELGEIFNDPFVVNYVPNWVSSIAPQYGCSNVMEVGDPVVGINEAITVPGISQQFHVQDLVFEPWFANAATSSSVNGWYTMFNSLSKVSASKCEIHSYVFTKIDFPGASSTQAFGINNQGQIVGVYADAIRGQNGFELSGGKFTTINCALENGTLLSDINDNSQIVGTYAFIGGFHGFQFEANGSCSDVIDPLGTADTNAWGIDDGGEIVGFYVDSGGAFQGFYDINGKFTTISCSGATDTRAYGINHHGGAILGDYETTAGGNFNGLFFVSNKCSTINFPNAASTSLKGINASGQISGWYNDGAFHGFVRSGSQFQTLDFPGATQTLAFHINDRGQVVGWYEDSAGGVHGFLATPRHEQAP
jgi:hypothetical protein